MIPKQYHKGTRNAPFLFDKAWKKISFVCSLRTSNPKSWALVAPGTRRYTSYSTPPPPPCLFGHNLSKQKKGKIIFLVVVVITCCLCQSGLGGQVRGSCEKINFHFRFVNLRWEILHRALLIVIHLFDRALIMFFGRRGRSKGGRVAQTPRSDANLRFFPNTRAAHRYWCRGGGEKLS